MKKIVKNVMLALLVMLVIIQFIHPSKNTSDPSALLVNDISRQYKVPDSIHQILEASCYDCHSNNTIYPWYSKIQPVAWWLNNHIDNMTIVC